MGDLGAERGDGNGREIGVGEGRGEGSVGRQKRPRADRETALSSRARQARPGSRTALIQGCIQNAASDM